jgi:PAS domain S-box-containing protein
VGVVAIVANATAAAYDSWRSHLQAVADTSRELENTAHIVAAQTAESLRTMDVLLRDTAEWYARSGAATVPNAVDAALASRAQGLPQLLRMTISDVHGIRRYSSRSGLADLDVSARTYFIAQRDNPKAGLFVSEPMTTMPEQRHVIALSRRLTDKSGRFAGVVTGFIDLDTIQAFYRRINLGALSSMLLLRDDGNDVRLVVREPPVRGGLGKPIPITPEFSMVMQSAVRMRTPIDGVERFVAGARVDGFPLITLVTRNSAIVLAPWREQALRVAGRTLLLTLLGALAIAALVAQLRRIERGERALRESEERYALAMEGANEGHFDWHLQGGPSFVSPRMHELCGRGPDTPVTTHAEVLAETAIHPDDRLRIDATLAEHMKGRTERYELEYRVHHPDGEWHWLLVRGRCMRNATGEPHRFLGSAIDVTERKRAEAERAALEERLRQAEKMEAIGRFASGIAHDFNNVLGGISAYGEMLLDDAPPGSTRERYARNVLTATARGRELVEQILTYTRKQRGKRVPTDLGRAAREALELIRSSIPASIMSVTSIPETPLVVIGNTTQIHQIVMNLCSNAIHAMPAEGTLRVAVVTVDVTAERSVSHGNLHARPYVCLRVEDTGSGMDEATLGRIFEPFFTTKEAGHGTGLGLALVYAIVADLEGGIEVKSVPAQGSTFSVYLPLAEVTVAVPTT